MKGTRQPLSPYYQKLADVLTIFWEYHKARLDAGTIAFGYEDGARGIRKYDGPKDWFADNAKTQSTYSFGLQSVDIINPFIKAVLRSLTLSWYDFLQQYPEDNRSEMDSVHRIRSVMRATESDEVIPFRSSYVDGLVNQARDDSDQGLQSIPSFDTAVADGMRTGAIVTTQLMSVMNSYFKPAIPLLVSRTSIGQVQDVRLHLRADADSGLSFRSFSPNQKDQGIIDPTQAAMLDVNRLIEAGYGHAMGCPAGHMPTEETQQFLETATGHRTSLPMLVDFSKLLHKEYERTIMEWWKGLNHEEQLQAQSQITEECYALLTGKRWEALREQREARQQTEVNGHTTETRRRGPRKRK